MSLDRYPTLEIIEAERRAAASAQLQRIEDGILRLMSPKEQLASDAPKCGNCKFMGDIIAKGQWGESKLFAVSGKGACQEPSVLQAYPVLFYVTDLMLCSRWEPKP